MADPLSSQDQDLMWRVLACWVADRPQQGSGDRFLDAFLQEFTPIDDNGILHSARRESLPINLGPDFGWLVGRPLPRTQSTVVPVATVQMDGRTGGAVERCCLRTALFQVRHDSTIHVEGWRFEIGEKTSDGSLPTHPYHHSQAIIGWQISSKCLLHPLHADGAECAGVDPGTDPTVDAEREAALSLVQQFHPAFPLASTTLTGLAAALIATMYGAPHARSVLSDARLERADGQVRADLENLLG